MVHALNSPTKSNIIDLRCVATKIAIYSNDEIGSKFMEAINYIQNSNIQNESFNALFDELYAIAQKETK